MNTHSEYCHSDAPRALAAQAVTPHRLNSIDFLRGGAALAVMLSHDITYGDRLPSNEMWFRALYALLDHGHLGVPLFFVISGFCVHLRWARQYSETKNGELDFISFWKRRIYRLYPPYFVMLCLSMMLIVIAYQMNRAVPSVTMYPEPRARWIAIDFFAHLTMLHGLHPILDKGGGNSPFWTLAREEYFYLLYFPLLAWRRRWGLLSSMIVVLLSGLAFPFLMSFVLPSKSSWWSIVSSSALVLWIQWCLGMTAVEAHYGLVKLPNWCRSWVLVPVWAGVALLCAEYSPWLAPLGWGMTFFTLLNYCVSLECAARWPRHRVINWLTAVGVFSYSLYLVHHPVRSVVKQLLGSFARTDSPIIYLLTAGLMAVLGYYAGKLFFAVVESRFLNTKRQPLAPVDSP